MEKIKLIKKGHPTHNIVQSFIHLSEITRVILVEKDSVVVLATGITTATRVSSVFANATVTGANVASLLPVVVQSGRLLHK